MLPFSPASDAKSEAVVGYSEDVTMNEEFQLLQRNFTDKHCQGLKILKRTKLTSIPFSVTIFLW